MTTNNQNQIQPFAFGDSLVRVVMIEGEMWWVAKDVCACLEIDNHRQALTRLDEDEVISNDVIDALGRPQETSLVNESGLYSLILGSRKPEAKAFKRWVTHEVLPTIRKTGGYGVAAPAALTEADREEIAQRAGQLAYERMIAAHAATQNKTVAARLGAGTVPKTHTEVLRRLIEWAAANENRFSIDVGDGRNDIAPPVTGQNAWGYWGANQLLIVRAEANRLFEAWGFVGSEVCAAWHRNAWGFASTSYVPFGGRSTRKCVVIRKKGFVAAGFTGHPLPSLRELAEATHE